MSSPNQYPENTFVPFESTLPVQDVVMPADFLVGREGIQGEGPAARFPSTDSLEVVPNETVRVPSAVIVTHTVAKLIPEDN